MSAAAAAARSRASRAAAARRREDRARAAGAPRSPPARPALATPPPPQAGAAPRLGGVRSRSPGSPRRERCGADRDGRAARACAGGAAISCPRCSTLVIARPSSGGSATTPVRPIGVRLARTAAERAARRSGREGRRRAPLRPPPVLAVPRGRRRRTRARVATLRSGGGRSASPPQPEPCAAAARRQPRRRVRRGPSPRSNLGRQRHPRAARRAAYTRPSDAVTTRVDERPVDQSIDLVQPVAGYSDADRDCHGRLHPQQEARPRRRRARRTRGPRRETRRLPTGSAAPRRPTRASAAARSPWSAGSDSGPPPRRRRGSRTPPTRPPAAESRELPATEAESGSARPRTAPRARSASTSNSTRSAIEPAAKSAYGRHRGDGSRPSGNTNATASGQAKKTGHSEETSAAQEPPGSDPGCASSATHAYGVAASTAASDSAPTTRIQPIGLRGRCADDQRAHRSRRRDRGEEQRVQPNRASSGNVLRGSDPIEHQPSRDQGHSRERQGPGNQTQRSPHAFILVERCAAGHSAGTELVVLQHPPGERPTVHEAAGRLGRGESSVASTRRGG